MFQEQQAVFLGYHSLSLLVLSLRFCTMAHMVSEKSIRATGAAVRQQHEDNQCQFSNLCVTYEGRTFGVKRLLVPRKSPPNRAENVFT